MKMILKIAISEMYECRLAFLYIFLSLLIIFQVHSFAVFNVCWAVHKDPTK